MTIQDIQEGIMIMQAANLGNPPNFQDPSTEQVLLKLLDDTPKDAYLRAVVKISQTKEFWPTVFQIRQAAIPENILLASDAWEEVQLEKDRCCGLPGVFPEFSSPIICRVVTSMGGLHEIWTDTREQYFIQKEFERKYNQLVSSDKMVTGGEVKELEG